MPFPKTDDTELGSIPTCPPAYAGPDGIAFQPSTPAWPSKVGKMFLEILIYVAWTFLGTALTLCIGVLIIDIRLAIPPLLESTMFVHLGPQSMVVREYSDMATRAHWAPPEPVWRRHHSWNDCPDWPETEQCKQKICDLDFTTACHNKTDLWKCKMCFSDEGEISRTDEALSEYCCESKRKSEVVWISICSAVGFLLLLALGGCMFKQTREKRRARERDRAIRLQDRELGAACRPHVDGVDETVRWTKSTRRVPVLPISRSRTSSANNAVDPGRVRARQGSGGSSGSHSNDAGRSSIPMPN